MLEKNLKSIGLNNNEVKVYLTLLETGTNKASFVAKFSEIPKTTVLDILNSLNKKGFITKIKKKNAYYFTAYEPDRIIKLLEKEEEELKKRKEKMKKVIPLLKNLQDVKSSKPKIEYLEGQDGLVEAFEDTLKIKNKNIYCYGCVDSQAVALPNAFPEYFEKRVKRKISTTCLIPATKPSLAECLLNDQKHLRRSYFIPGEMVLPMEINIYDDTTNIASFDDKFAVIIKSKPVADCMRNLFQLAFEGAEKYDKKIRQETDIDEMKKFWKKWKRVRKSPSAQKVK
ncbi:hypothetical protein KKC88_02245 [Patescibacteria group bacterium]|nr:hypothetical protein [Patescibacteria group bacterium]MBU1673128.1 hypothetical protein [Patescibacteria group bacterium]MBU1963806.1 hypothetical protein [Patescibacteria group bacterium]